MEALMPDVKVETVVAEKGERMAEDGPIETGNDSFTTVDVGRADTFELAQVKEETPGRTLREVMQSDSQSMVTNPSSKKFVRRLMALVSKRKLGGAKLWLKVSDAVDAATNTKDLPTIFESSSRSSECRDELSLLCDQAEATLGELLVKAGATFANQYGPRRRLRRSSLSQIMRLSGRVFCGSATEAVVNDADSSALAPLTSEGENSSSEFLADYVVREVLSMIQGGSSERLVVESSATAVRTETNMAGNGRNSEISHGIASVDAPISEGDTRNNSLTFLAEDSSLEWWSSSGESTRSPTHSRSHSLGGNTRLNTMLAESPILAHTHRRPSDVEAVQVQPFERFLVRGVEETLRAAVVETPTRVSLMSLLQETEEAMVVTRYPIANGEGDKSWDASTTTEGGDLDPMCCVCMVSRKGAAFIPCGHTFCRSCTRELWKARQVCALCNKSILQILDLY